MNVPERVFQPAGPGGVAREKAFSEEVNRGRRQLPESWCDRLVEQLAPGVKVRLVEYLTPSVRVSLPDTTPEPDVVVEE